MEAQLYDEMFKDEKNHWWYKARRNIILGFLEEILKGKKKEDVNILDCGCGCGYLLTCLEKYGDVRGIDMSDRALAYSSQRFAGKLFKMDLSKDTGNFNKNMDVLLALDVIEHIEDDQAALLNMKQMLKDDGKILLTVPAYKMLWSYHDDINMHKRRYCYKDLRALLEKCGYRVEYLSYYNTFLFLPIWLARLVKSKGKNRKSDGTMPSPFVNSLLEKIFYSERFFLKKRIKLPFGVSLIAIISKDKKEINSAAKDKKYEECS